MRRKDKEITDKAAIEEILQKAQVCRLALCENNIPYIVPMNYGYKDGYLYVHGAKEGKKTDMIAANPNVCFEVDMDHELVKGENGSEWTYKYHSVIGYGKAEILQAFEEKKQGLDIIMEHYSGSFEHQYPEAAVHAVSVIRIKIEEMTGKKSGY